MGLAGRIARVLALTGALTSAASAHAEWMEARSKHFIVYSDDSAADVRDTATRLERFDQIIRRLNRLEDAEGQGSNPVTVYVVSSVEAVQRLYGGSGNIAGFYVPRVSGSVVFTPRYGRDNGPGDLKPQIVLFHEYGHHLLLGNSAIAYPSWFTEGYAEFVSTTKLQKDFAQVGVPAQHRAYGLFTTGMPIERLFDPKRTKVSDAEHEALYGRGWLLTHYLIFHPKRFSEFQTYLKLLNGGTPPIASATQAFGDLKQLNRELQRYLNASTMPVLNTKYADLPAPEVTVTSLSPGARALIGYRIQSERGVNATTAPPLYARAKAAAAPYANDATAQGWLAEMAFDARQDDAAEAAADRALAADPKSVQALIYKAQVHLRRAQEARTADPKTWSEARGWIVKANRLDHDNAEPLALYYGSFGMEGRPPTKSARDGLARAFQLVPQDRGVRFAMVRQRLLDKDVEGAKVALRPLAYDPHSDPDNPAVKLLALLDATKDPAAAIAAMEQRDGAQEGD